MTGWRVTSWNLLGARDPDLSSIAAVLRAQDIDAAGLQEIRRSQIRRLARHLGWHYAWTRKHYPYSPLVWWRAEGLGIVSPWQVSNRLRTTISPGVSTWTFKHRVLLAATITRRDGTLRVFNTHLASHDTDERIEQAKRVADRLRTDPARLRILTGDLNTTDGSDVEVLREFRRIGLVDPGGNNTEPANAPHQRLDYVLVPFDATVTSTHTPEGSDTWRDLSDHLPTLVEFTPA